MNNIMKKISCSLFVFSATLSSGLTLADNSQSVYQMKVKIDGLKKTKSCEPSELPDGYHVICDQDPNKLYPVVNGSAFELTEAYAKDAFTCPAGSRYATDDEAISLVSVSGNPIYTPYGSYEAVYNVPAASTTYLEARGKASYRSANGNLSSAQMYSSHKNSSGWKYRAVPGTKDSLQLRRPLGNNGPTYSPSITRPNMNTGAYKACAL